MLALPFSVREKKSIVYSCTFSAVICACLKSMTGPQLHVCNHRWPTNRPPLSSRGQTSPIPTPAKTAEGEDNLNHRLRYTITDILHPFLKSKIISFFLSLFYHNRKTMYVQCRSTQSITMWAFVTTKFLF